jgi:hypothetical protein
MLKQFHNLYQVTDGANGGAPTSELSEDDIAKALSEGADDSKLEAEVIDIKEKKDDKKEDKKDESLNLDEDDDDKGEKKDEEKVEDELDELEKELEGPTEEQLELMTPARRKDILKAYPDLFEKFPYLETAYYRDQRFTEFFPTFKDAEEAATNAKAYVELNQKIESGDFEQIVSGLKTKGEPFNRFVDNIMPLIHKVDRGAFEHLVGNTGKEIVRAMIAEADDSKNDSLKTAAVLMHQFLFGTSKFTEPTNLSSTKPNEANPEADKLKKEREEYESAKFRDAQNGLADRVNNVIKATIIKFIDEKDVMTPYVKNAAIKDALNKVEQLISKDTRFRTVLDKLWEDAAKKNYDKAAMEKIKSACISKARILLPSVIKTARNEALKGMGKKVNESSDKGSQSKRSSTPPDKGGKANESQQGKVPAGMTEEEYLMSDD